jgi:hypothetical protein
LGVVDECGVSVQSLNLVATTGAIAMPYWVYGHDAKNAQRRDPCSLRPTMKQTLDAKRKKLAWL